MSEERISGDERRWLRLACGLACEQQGPGEAARLGVIAASAIPRLLRALENAEALAAQAIEAAPGAGFLANALTPHPRGSLSRTFVPSREQALTSPTLAACAGYTEERTIEAMHQRELMLMRALEQALVAAPVRMTVER